MPGAAGWPGRQGREGCGQENVVCISLIPRPCEHQEVRVTGILLT